jgi:hypothetical protein
LPVAEGHPFHVAPNHYELIVSEDLSQPPGKWGQPARRSVRRVLVCSKQYGSPDFVTATNASLGVSEDARDENQNENGGDSDLEHQRKFSWRGSMV